MFTASTTLINPYVKIAKLYWGQIRVANILPRIENEREPAMHCIYSRGAHFSVMTAESGR
jgi:hypothetical protein